jgi:hypothetical protein
MVTVCTTIKYKNQWRWDTAHQETMNAWGRKAGNYDYIKGVLGYD